jgi:hypothetical protein
MQCSRCSNPIDRQTQFCPYCDLPVPGFQRKMPSEAKVADSVFLARLILVTALLLMVWIGLGSYLVITYSDPDSLYLVTEYINGKVYSRRIESGLALAFHGVLYGGIILILGGACVIYKRR